MHYIRPFPALYNKINNNYCDSCTNLSLLNEISDEPGDGLYEADAYIVFKKRRICSSLEGCAMCQSGFL